jgi:hypothetical protein
MVFFHFGFDQKFGLVYISECGESDGFRQRKYTEARCQPRGSRVLVSYRNLKLPVDSSNTNSTKL